MKTSSLFLGSALRRGALALVVLPLVAGGPLACLSKDDTSVITSGLEPGSEGNEGNDSEPDDSDDGQTGSNTGSGNQGAGGSGSASSGGPGNEPGGPGAGRGGSDAAPAPQCVTFDNAERVPLYDGTNLPPLN